MFLFVGGSQRSGTSITQQLLCQLPDANPYLYESSFLRELVQCYANARDNFGLSHASYFEGIQNLRDFCSGVVRAFLQQTETRLGNPGTLILKEPHLTQFWPYLFELVPEAVFLLVVRDPRDVVASMIRVGQKQEQSGQPAFFSNRDMPALCRHFLSFYQPCLEFRSAEFRKRLGIVLYEDLVQDTRSALRDISLFTETDFEQIDIEAPLDTGLVRQADTAASAHFAPWMTALSGQNVSRKSVGGFHETLSDSEVATVETLCGDFFDAFGYQRSAA